MINKAFQPDKISLNKGDFVRFGILLGFKASDLLAQLQDLASQLRDLAFAVLTVAVEQAQFAEQNEISFADDEATLHRRRDLVQPVALSQKPGLSCVEFGEMRAHDGKFSARLDIVEAQDDLILCDEVTFLDGYLADDAAVAMLNGLEVLIDLDRSVSDNGACERGRGTPPSDANNKQ